MGACPELGRQVQPCRRKTASLPRQPSHEERTGRGRQRAPGGRRGRRGGSCRPAPSEVLSKPRGPDDCACCTDEKTTAQKSEKSCPGPGQEATAAGQAGVLRGPRPSPGRRDGQGGLGGGRGARRHRASRAERAKDGPEDVQPPCPGHPFQAAAPRGRPTCGPAHRQSMCRRYTDTGGAGCTPARKPARGTLVRPRLQGAGLQGWTPSRCREGLFGQQGPGSCPIWARPGRHIGLCLRQAGPPGGGTGAGMTHGSGSPSCQAQLLLSQLCDPGRSSHLSGPPLLLLKSLGLTRPHPGSAHQIHWGVVTVILPPRTAIAECAPPPAPPVPGLSCPRPCGAIPRSPPLPRAAGEIQSKAPCPTAD